MASPSKPLTITGFFSTAEELGYRVHRYAGKYLLASVDPEDKSRFPGCVVTPYLAIPTRERLEVTLPVDEATVAYDDAA